MKKIWKTKKTAVDWFRPCRCEQHRHNEYIELETTFACCCLCSMLCITYSTEGGRKTPEKRPEEIKAAEEMLLKDVQRCCFPAKLHAIPQSKGVASNSHLAALFPFLNLTGTIRVEVPLRKIQMNPETNHQSFYQEYRFTKLLVEDIN